MPTRQAPHSYRGTVAAPRPGQPIILPPAQPYPLAGPVATFVNMPLAEFDNTALIVCGSPANIHRLPGSGEVTFGLKEMAEIVGVVKWGAESAFNTVEFDWRSGCSFSVAADFVSVGAYINQLIPGLTLPTPVVTYLMSVDLSLTIGPSPGLDSHLQRTLGRYNESGGFTAYHPGDTFSLYCPAYAADFTPIATPGSTWKIEVHSFYYLPVDPGPVYIFTAGTTPVYPLSAVDASLPRTRIQATCLGGSGFCRFIFNLDI